ncbi:MAG: ATP-grasp fold amidoligase family protein [Parachlamydiaceae bacterium]
MIKNQSNRFFRFCCYFPLFFLSSSANGMVKNHTLPYAVQRTAPEMTHPLDTLTEWFSDCKVIRNGYKSVFGKYPNLKNPTTFSEKIAYKRLYDRRAILTQIADKIHVRNFVESRIGSKYLQTIYQIAKTPEEIDWDSLPSQFVLKTNHGSGWNIIVHNKNTLDIKEATSKLKYWLNTNYYNYTREWCYKHIPPVVFVEKLLLDDQGKIPTDWKFFVFSGHALYIQVNINRFEYNQCNIYDRNLKKMGVRYHWDNFSADLVFPPNIEEMFTLAEQLGEGFDFVRVDLYNVNGRIFFGELTNYPLAGFAPFTPDKFDKQLGDCWSVPARY